MSRLAPIALAVLAASALLAALAGGRMAAQIFAVTVSLFPAAVCAVGARTPRGRTLALLLGLLLGVWIAGLILLTSAAAGEVPGARSGLPFATWWMLGGGAVAPLLLLGAGYAAIHRGEQAAAGDGGRR